MADVSVEALQKVKSALISFQNDITGISSRATTQVQNCLGACYQKIDETQAKINELNTKITKLSYTISDFDSQINVSLNKIQKLESAVSCMQKRLPDIENSINSFQRQLLDLQVQLANVENDEIGRQIRSQIDTVTQQLNLLYHEQSELKYQIRGLENEKEDLYQKVNRLKSEKARSEECWIIAKKRKFQYQQKFDRLKSLLEMEKSNLEDYANATRKFESSFSASVGQNIQVVHNCITHIEEYLSTVL